jgi:ribA/ribD-fused uncharacterized protein
MNTISTALFCLIGMPLFAADLPKPSTNLLLPALSSEIIISTPSYQTYKTTTGTPAQSWRETDAILFYSKYKPYYEFTNFYPASVVIEGVEWPTTEHYYQAMKFTDATLQACIRHASTAREAFDLGNKNKHFARTDWQKINLAIMALAICKKFSQHAQLGQLLLATGTQVLVEDAGEHDSFFGAGADYKGHNYLGRILMLVRTTLVQESNV